MLLLCIASSLTTFIIVLEKQSVLTGSRSKYSTTRRIGMSAAARAEARRKAILSRGTDRLNKLTTSARGEDSPGIIVHDGESAFHLVSDWSQTNAGGTCKHLFPLLFSMFRPSLTHDT